MANTNTFNEESLLKATTTTVITDESNPKPTDHFVNDKSSVTENGTGSGGDNGTKDVKENGVLVQTSRCVGRSNRGVTWGKLSEQGRSKTMEDTVGVYPGFMHLSCNEVGGCTAPECKYALHKSPLHFFGVFDGHGGPQWWEATMHELSGSVN